MCLQDCLGDELCVGWGGGGTCRCGLHHALGSELSRKGKAEDRGNTFYLSFSLAFPSHVCISHCCPRGALALGP